MKEEFSNGSKNQSTLLQEEENTLLADEIYPSGQSVWLPVQTMLQS
jgi:hypothetical protein